jgi:uncharacterized protein (TIGR02444 family)
MFPASPFWDFSLRLYARPGVADSCLALQKRHGIDVNLLFCCLWLGIEGERLAKRDIARLAACVRTLHESVVKPLRQARTVLKSLLASEDESLRPVLGTLRTAIKKSELDAEHLEQIILGGLRSRNGAAAGSADLAQANARAYLARTAGRLGAADEVDLARIIAALSPSRTAKVDAALQPKSGRTRPLARRGEGRNI